MDRFEMIGVLYMFIRKKFDIYYWESANKYSYYSIDFASFDSYNDFLLNQELTLYIKSTDDLLLLLNIIDMIELGMVQVMNQNNMRPDIAHGLLFDTNGSVIIYNSK